MKKFTFGIFILLGLLFSSQLCQAAFPVHSANASTVITANPESSAVISSKPASNAFTAKAGGKAKISQILYIVMAIIAPLGALAMGINDNFEGYDWLISLVLYFIGIIPGIIYTLIKMNKYY